MRKRKWAKRKEGVSKAQKSNVDEKEDLVKVEEKEEKIFS